MRVYTIYGLKVRGVKGFRYVGQTIVDPRERLSGHFSAAKHKKSSRKVLDWINKHGRDKIEMVILESCPDDLGYLNYAERYWIASLRDLGHDLLNHTLGGEGVPGLPAWNKDIPMSEEQKELMRIINTGKVLTKNHKQSIGLGVARHFEENGHKPVYDFWLEKYGKEEADRLRGLKKSKASATLSGEGNPMFGRSGQDAPCYGRVGELHPMFGTHHSEEAKARISKAHKGKKLSDATKLRMSFAQHTRSHQLKTKDTCIWCQGHDLQEEIKKRELELNDKKVE